MTRTAAMFVLALVLGALPALADGKTLELESKNLRWTLPSEDWTFSEVSRQQADAGYLTMVSNENVAAQMFVQVRPTEDLPLADLAHEMLEAARGSLESVSASGVGDAKISGIDGKVATVEGKAVGGADAHFSYFAISQGSRFYILIVRTWHGAHRKDFAAIDAVRRGLRLIKGAGPEEAPASPPPGSTDEPPPENAGNWPPDGPERKGDTVRFPSHNIEWTIPSDSVFKIKNVISNEKETQPSLFLRVTASSPRKSKVSEADAEKVVDADNNLAEIRFEIHPRQPGWRSDVLVNDSGFKSNCAKKLDETLPGGARIEDEYEVAGATGSLFELRGKIKDDYVTETYFVVGQRGEIYIWIAKFTGERDADRTFRDEVDKLIANARFIDPSEPVAGPLAGAVGAWAAERGKMVGKEQDLTVRKATLTKPAEMARITDVHKDYHFALEGRSEDGQAYLYFDVRTMDKRALQQQNVDEADLVKRHAENWLSVAGEGAAVSKSAKRPPHYKDRWDRGKGVGYRFTGDLNGTPFVEQGWIVAHKTHLYWLRVQFGGADAEKTMAKTFKALKKSWKFTK